MGQPTTAFGNRLVSEMRQLVYGKMRRRATDPLQGLSAASINEYIATWDAYFWDYAKWTFARTSKIVTFTPSSTLSVVLNTADLTFTVASAAALTALGGRVSINQDDIDYSSAAGAVATISTTGKGSDVSHILGERVDFLPAVPTDYGKPGEMWIGDATNPARTKIRHQDNRTNYWPNYPNYFVQDGYLYLPRSLTQTRAQLTYYKKAFKPVELDSLQTPRKHDNFVLWATMAEVYQTIGDTENADYYFRLAGVPTPNNPDPTGILQMAAASDAEQTASLDEIFVPEYA